MTRRRDTPRGPWRPFEHDVTTPMLGQDPWPLLRTFVRRTIPAIARVLDDATDDVVTIRARDLACDTADATRTGRAIMEKEIGRQARGHHISWTRDGDLVMWWLTYSRGVFTAERRADESR